LSEKIRSTKRARLADGVYGGGGPAFGYKLAKGGPVIDPEEAAAIHDAVTRLAEGVTIYRLTMTWNEAGLRTANDTRWRVESVRRLLTSDHLTGARGYPRILDETEAAIVRDRIGARKMGRPPGRRYVATPFMYCAECGHKLTTGADAYRCRPGPGCGKVSIKATDVEMYLLRAWVAHDQKVKRKASKRPPAPPDPSPVLAELHDVEHQLAEVTEALGDGSLSVAVAGPASKALEERRRALTEELARSLPPAQPGRRMIVIELESGEVFVTDKDKVFGPEAGEAFMRRWQARELTGNEVEDLRDFLTIHIQRVEVSPRVKRGREFEPRRVKIAWR